MSELFSLIFLVIFIWIIASVAANFACKINNFNDRVRREVLKRTDGDDKNEEEE